MHCMAAFVKLSTMKLIKNPSSEFEASNINSLFIRRRQKI